MSNVLIGIIGVIFFVGLAVAGASYMGPKLTTRKVDADAVNYLNQTRQITKAAMDYARENGKLPVEPGKQPLDILIEDKYLSAAPPGGTGGWQLDATQTALVTPAASNPDDGLKVCIAARERARMPNPTHVLKCDGSDAPGGALSNSDPCCIM